MKALLKSISILFALAAIDIASAAPVALTVARELQPPEGDVANGYGKAVACNERFIAVGAPGAHLPAGSADQGAVYVYDAISYKLLRRLRAPKPAGGEKFGSALALEGSLLYVGAPGHTGGAANGGAVYAYDLATGARKWTFTSTTAGEGLGGHAIAIAADIVAVGQPFSKLGDAPTESGYVRMIHRKFGMEMGIVTAPAAKAGDRCGFSLCGSGHFLAVGVPSSDLPGTNEGMVLMVDARSPYFAQETFYPSSGGGFGQSVALNGPRLWVGSPSSLQFFKPIDGTYGSFVSTPSGSSAEFGQVLATVGSHVACSDPLRPGGAKVHGFDLEYSTLTWELTDPNAAQPASRFGRSLALSSSHVVVGDGHGLPRVIVAALPALPWNAGRVKQILTSGTPAPGESANFAAITTVDAAVNIQGKVLAPHQTQRRQRQGLQQRQPVEHHARFFHRRPHWGPVWQSKTDPPQRPHHQWHGARPVPGAGHRLQRAHPI
jgi:hypothetical protein